MVIVAVGVRLVIVLNPALPPAEVLQVIHKEVIRKEVVTSKEATSKEATSKERTRSSQVTTAVAINASRSPDRELAS